MNVREDTSQHATAVEEGQYVCCVHASARMTRAGYHCRDRGVTVPNHHRYRRSLRLHQIIADVEDEDSAGRAAAPAPDRRPYYWGLGTESGHVPSPPADFDNFTWRLPCPGYEPQLPRGPWPPTPRDVDDHLVLGPPDEGLASVLPSFDGEVLLASAEVVVAPTVDMPEEEVPKRQRHDDMLELLPAEPVIWQGATPLAESIAVQWAETQRLHAEEAQLQDDRKTLQASRRTSAQASSASTEAVPSSVLEVMEFDDAKETVPKGDEPAA